MKNLLLLFLLFLSISATAQYEFFTNIGQNQLYDNSSLTGSSCGPRLLTSFKSFRLRSNEFGYISYDQPITFKNGDYIGIGGNLIHVNNSLYRINSASVLTSYNRLLSSTNDIEQYLSLGFGFTLSQQHLFLEKLSTPGQIFDPLNQIESIKEDIQYPRIEVGLSYSLMKNEHEFVRAGVSIKNINQPDITFYGNEPFNLPSIFILSAAGSTLAKGNIYWQPNIRFYKTENYSNISYASNFKFIIGNKSNGIIAGVGYSNKYNKFYNKTISVNLGADWGRLSCIFSYDYKLKSDEPLLLNPSFDFGIGYRFCD